MENESKMFGSEEVRLDVDHELRPEVTQCLHAGRAERRSIVQNSTNDGSDKLWIQDLVQN